MFFHTVAETRTVAARHDPTTIKRRINIAAVGSSHAATNLLGHPTPDSEKKPLCISVLSVVKNSAFFPQARDYKSCRRSKGLSQKPHPVVIARRNDEAIR
jgi:hypothetical protein